MNNLKDIIREYEELYRSTKESFLKYGKIYIAYDFDDTIYSLNKPNNLIDRTISILKKWELHAKFILFTCRSGEWLEFALKEISDKEIPLDWIGENKEVEFGGKPYYNLFLEDKSSIMVPLMVLEKIYKEEIEGKNQNE